MDKLTIKEGHLTDFTITVKDESTNTPLDLTDYDWVNFVMVDKSNTAVINTAWAFVWDKTSWTITYVFQTWDTDTVWSYKAYFSLLKSWVKKLAVPTDYFWINITEDFID